MRLHRITVENLNAFHGVHVVDLDGPLEDVPLFLIAGPTGSGKSTLLDAVGLALFGFTPRLEGAREKAAKGDINDGDPRHMVSKGTGTGRAELEFSLLESGKRRRYRATWSCHRARKKADGAFQDASRALDEWVDGSGWKNLVDSNKAKELAPHFERVLAGMTAEDFQRSVLLAQGHFAAFLNATEDERARILERLTRTDFYRTVGGVAARRFTELKQALEGDARQLQGMQVPSPAEIGALEGQTAEAKETHASILQRRTVLRAMQQWLEAEVSGAVALKTAQDQAHQLETDVATHGKDRARLAEHQRVSPARVLLEEASRAHAVQVVAAQKVPASHAALQAASAQVLERTQAADRSKTSLTVVRAEREARRPELERAKALDAQLELLSTKAREAVAQEEKAAREAERANKDAAAAEARREKANASLVGKQEAWGRLEAWSQHQEDVNRFHAVLERVGAAWQALDAAQAEAREASTHVPKAQAAADQARTLVAAGHANLEVLEAQRQQAELALTSLCAGAGDVGRRRAALDQQWEAAQRRQSEMEAVARVETQRLECKTRREAAGVRVAQLGQELLETETSLAGATKHLELGGQELEGVELDLQNHQRVLDMAIHRETLKPGDTCPLCGSTSHPFVDSGEHADLDRATRERVATLEARHASLKKANKGLEKVLLALGKEQAGKQAALALEQRNLEVLEQQHVALGVDLQAQRSAAEDSQGAASPQEIMEQVRQLKLKLDAAERALANATTTRDARRTTVEKASTALVEVTHVLATAARKVEESAARAAQLKTDLDGRLDDALVVARLLPLDAAPNRDLAALKAAGAEAWEKLKAVLALQKELDAALAEVAKAAEAGTLVDAARLKAVADHTQHQQDATAAKAAAQAAQTERASLLGGQTTAQEEVRLHRLEKAAVDEEAAAVKLLEQARVQEASARTAWEGAQQAASKAQQDAVTAEAALVSLLATLNVADVAELQTRLMEEAAAQALAAVLAGVDGRLVQAREQVASLAAHAAAHAQQRPEPLDGMPFELALVRQEALVLEAALEQAAQVLGSSTGALAAAISSREKHGALVGALEKRREELVVWSRLHDLIGVKEGGRFQKFAQTLNLADLMERANAHLEKLSDRYSLVGAVGPDKVPLLGFHIRDNAQAGETRPLTTLSGGETFLVSLAMALALADSRTVRMRLETLLIDEGFGTLDPATLEVAVQALETLRHRGVRVGVISHVEALKERIPARILVERLGEGRSRVKVDVG